TELEARQDGLTARMADARQDVPDMHPGIAETYRRRIERLTAALAHPDDAAEAAEAIREIIDRIVITPGPTRGDLSVTLQGELGTILDWIDRTGKPGYKPAPDTASSRLSASVKARAWKKKMPKIARHTGLIRRSICGCWAFQCLYIQYTPYSPRVTRKSTLILPREVTKKCARFAPRVSTRGASGVL
ncbi:TPA: hypothetical protein ACLPK7_006065, partial [Pseudomonas aeruginosa]